MVLFTLTLAESFMRFAFNVLILVLVFPFSLPAIVDSQTTAQPATGVSIDLSQMNFYQLRQKRDLLDAQIQKDQAQRSTLDTTVYWLKQEANGKRDLADEQKKSQPDKKRIDELTKAIIHIAIIPPQILLLSRHKERSSRKIAKSIWSRIPKIKSKGR